MPPLFGVIANHTTIAIFSVLSAGDPDFDGIYARSAAKENESGAIKYRCSCIWENAQEQRVFFCMHINPAPAPEQPTAMHTMMVLDAALGKNLYSDGSGRWGSLACMRRQASSFTSSMITAVRGIKKMIPMIA